MELDTTRLTDYLSTTLGQDITDLAVRQFQHGQSNPTYLVTLITNHPPGKRRVVLRKKPPGTLLPGAHAVEREYRVMEALGRAGVPAPNLIALCTDESVLGTPFYLMDYVRGRVHKDPSLPGMTPKER